MEHCNSDFSVSMYCRALQEKKCSFCGTIEGKHIKRADCSVGSIYSLGSQTNSDLNFQKVVNVWVHS